jgi:hypothetical protein
MNISERRPIAHLTFEAISTSKLRHSHRSRTLAAMMMSKFHKPVNWQARWLLPAAPLLGGIFNQNELRLATWQS